MPVQCRLSFGCCVHPGQAAGERRGEGEPELDRRPAPSHPLELCVYGESVQAKLPARADAHRAGRVREKGFARRGRARSFVKVDWNLKLSSPFGARSF